MLEHGCIQFYGTKQRKGMPGNSEKKNESILGSQAATFNLVSVVEHYDFLRKNGSQCALDMAFLIWLVPRDTIQTISERKG